MTWKAGSAFESVLKHSGSTTLALAHDSYNSSDCENEIKSAVTKVIDSL
jgi:hypothetical protein